MPNWYYDKKELKNTPSIRDGLDFETDRRYRKEGARFIIECGTKMGLGHNTMATGVVYFHRFYVFHSFKSFPRYVTACCCLFLAGKVEETPKKCRDIIRMARTMLNDQKYQSFGEDAKEEVMTLERILLQTIKFDLQVEHPYRFIVKYAKCLKGDQLKLQKMVQMAWNFVNDSLSTTVCLQWEPEIIAVALIHLASKLSKFSVTKWDGQQPQHLRWWDMFVADVTMEILEDICHQVLDLYQQPNATDVDSPPQQPPSKASPPAKRAKLGDGGSAVGGGVGGSSGVGAGTPVYTRVSPAAAASAAVAAVGLGANVQAGLHQAPPPPPPSNYHQHHTKAAAIGDEKPPMQQHQQQHPQQHARNSLAQQQLPPPMDSMYGAGANSSYGQQQQQQQQYGSMYQHGQFGGQQQQQPPPLPISSSGPHHNQHQQQQQTSMYASGNQLQQQQQVSHGSYGAPQQIPAHYQSSGGGGGGNGGGGSQGYHYQQQQQQQSHPSGGRGGYYQGPT